MFHIYITLSASSNFPGIAWLSFAKFTEKLKITQDDSINQQDIDRYFMASAGEMTSSGCYRYQFFEAVMRVAKTRFLDSGQAADYAEALQKFLDIYAFKSGPTNEWQEWRDNVWWSYETHSIC